MGVNAEIVVLFDTPAEAAAEAVKLKGGFWELFNSMLVPAACGCALVVSGLTRYVELDPTNPAWGTNLDQWPPIGLAIRILQRHYGLERVRYGNDHIDLDTLPYDTWPIVSMSTLAFMDEA